MGTEPCSGGRSVEAIQAALEVAAAFGVQVKEPVLLRATNNTAVWFRPTVIFVGKDMAEVIVAKVVSLTTEDWQTKLHVAMELTVVGGHQPRLCISSRLSVGSTLEFLGLRLLYRSLGIGSPMPGFA